MFHSNRLRANLTIKILSIIIADAVAKNGSFDFADESACVLGGLRSSCSYNHCHTNYDPVL